MNKILPSDYPDVYPRALCSYGSQMRAVCLQSCIALEYNLHQEVSWLPALGGRSLHVLKHVSAIPFKCLRTNARFYATAPCQTTFRDTLNTDLSMHIIVRHVTPNMKECQLTALVNCFQQSSLGSKSELMHRNQKP